MLQILSNRYGVGAIPKVEVGFDTVPHDSLHRVGPFAGVEISPNLLLTHDLASAMSWGDKRGVSKEEGLQREFRASGYGKR